MASTAVKLIGKFLRSLSHRTVLYRPLSNPDWHSAFTLPSTDLPPRLRPRRPPHQTSQSTSPVTHASKYPPFCSFLSACLTTGWLILVPLSPPPPLACAVRAVCCYCREDGMFKGIYHGKQCHAADIPAVLARAWAAGVDRIIVSILWPSLVSLFSPSPDSPRFHGN